MQQYPALWMRYRSSLLQARMDFNIPEPVNPILVWIHGRTGTGKTRFAYEWDPTCWISNESLQYFSGYTDQPTLL